MDATEAEEEEEEEDEGKEEPKVERLGRGFATESVAGSDTSLWLEGMREVSDSEDDIEEDSPALV